MKRELMLGKLSPEILQRYLLSKCGALSKEVIIPPKIGVDFGVVKLGRDNLIISSDPITGVSEGIGWYAVNVSANDVATSGNRPRFMESVILLPEYASLHMVKDIALQISRTAKSLGITIIGGHTEVTPRLERPIVVTTAFTYAKSFVSAADAQKEDSLMLTKSAGIEGTVILSYTANKFTESINDTTVFVTKFFKKLSVVNEAEDAFRTGYVHAMHDCTEGGVLGAVYEMSSASKLGFEIFEEEIPVANETKRLCKALKLNPLKLISSGALLLAVEPGKEERVRDALKRIGVPVATIGRLLQKRRILVHATGIEEDIKSAPVDELWKIKKRIGSLSISTTQS
jgi:hydrogenase maturation factor